MLPFPLNDSKVELRGLRGENIFCPEYYRDSSASLFFSLLRFDPLGHPAASLFAGLVPYSKKMLFGYCEPWMLF